MFFELVDNPGPGHEAVTVSRSAAGPRQDASMAEYIGEVILLRGPEAPPTSLGMMLPGNPGVFLLPATAEPSRKVWALVRLQGGVIGGDFVITDGDEIFSASPITGRDGTRFLRGSGRLPFTCVMTHVGRKRKVCFVVSGKGVVLKDCNVAAILKVCADHASDVCDDSDHSEGDT